MKIPEGGCVTLGVAVSRKTGCRLTPVAPSAGAPAGNGADVPMSEAQRRYLFRLLAAQGLEGEAAHDTLTDLMGVASLKEVTRHQATKAIDDLLKRAGAELSRGAA